MKLGPPRLVKYVLATSATANEFNNVEGEILIPKSELGTVVPNKYYTTRVDDEFNELASQVNDQRKAIYELNAAIQELKDSNQELKDANGELKESILRLNDTNRKFEERLNAADSKFDKVMGAVQLYIKGQGELFLNALTATH